MPKKQPLNPADYIEPLYMNGLHGRMLRMKAPSRKNREILIVYGQHASLERMFGVAESLNKYGAVTIPDLPGFGGMQSYYRIKEKPTIDNLADYLASFVKLRYKNRRVTIIGVSYGFAITTRMLQRYPEITRKVDMLISAVGFVHHDDFVFKRGTITILKYGSSLLAHGFTSRLARLFLRPSFIRAVYQQAGTKNPKLNTTDMDERDRRIAFEIHLWRTNDIRTYMYSNATMLKLDLCGNRVDLPVHHISFPQDKYFNNDFVKQHLEVIYNDVFVYIANIPAHVPTLATVDDASKFIPAALRRLLAKS